MRSAFSGMKKTRTQFPLPHKITAESGKTASQQCAVLRRPQLSLSVFSRNDSSQNTAKECLTMCGNDCNSWWIIILILILFMSCGCGCGCGNNNCGGNNCGCGC